jgi:hypothetical protein
MLYNNIIMDSINNIIDLLDCRESSKQSYKNKLSYLYKVLNDDIYDVQTTMQYINNTYDNVNTKRAYYEALNKINNCNEYYDELNLLYEQIRINKLNNVLTDKQIENWVSVDELKAIPQCIENEIVKKFGKLWLIGWVEFHTLTKLKKQKYARMILEYILILLTVYHPLRSDYYNVKIKFEDDGMKDNFLLIKQDKIELHMNHYKNSDKYINTNVQILEPEAYQCVNNWIKLYQTMHEEIPEYILYVLQVNLNMKPYNSGQTYTGAIIRIIKHYTKKHITINCIRKIYESEFIQSEEYKNMTNKQKEEQHQKLLHSHSVAVTKYNMIKK